MSYNIDDTQTIRIGYFHSAPLLDTATNEPNPALDVEREVEALRTVFKESGQKILFRQEVATVPKFQKLLAKGCALLHFTGHGLNTGELAFETEQGELHPLRSNNLRELLLSEDGETIRTKVAFISACHSQQAGDVFERAGVPHVVAIKLGSTVMDKIAIEFSEIFYSTLLAGHTVKYSFDRADRTVRANRKTPQFTDSEFLLLPRNSPTHEVALFQRVEHPVRGRMFQDETAPTPTNTCNFPPRPFVGRHVEMHKAFKYFVDGSRCVSITGISGIGKSALACRLAYHLAQRHMFCRVLCFDLGEDSETLPRVVNHFRSRTLSDTELVRRALALLLEEALNDPHGVNGNANELWCREYPPDPTDLLNLVKRVVKSASGDLLSPAHRPSDPLMKANVSAVATEPSSPRTEMEREAAAVHERWRAGKRNELLAQGGTRLPCWRRLDPNEVVGWLQQLSETEKQSCYLVAPPLAAHPSVPDESPPDDQSWLEVPIQRPPSVHWVDIDIDYKLLPESWKEKNRVQVPYRTRATSGAADPALPPWSPHSPPPPTSMMGMAEDDAGMSAPLRPLLLVIDGADMKRNAVAEILNKLFHKYQLICVLSTCEHGLTGDAPLHGASYVHSGVVALDAEPEKQIRIEALRDAEAAELLVHSSPRNLTLTEMGLTSTSTWSVSMHILSQRPAVKALQGHPRAIRQFAPRLNMQKTANNGGGGVLLLDDLVEIANTCYHVASQSRNNPIHDVSYSSYSPETLAAFEKLKGDEKSLNIWKQLTKRGGKSLNGGEGGGGDVASHEQVVQWHGSAGLAVLIEKDLNDESVVNGNVIDLPNRRLGQSDIAYLQRIMFPPKSGKPKEDITFDNFVKFAKWWCPIREVVRWLGVTYRGGRVGGAVGGGVQTMIHGFLDRKNANEILQDKPFGTFLLRFSEREPNQLVIVFNEQVGRPATHCLVQLIDRSRCCITFEGGARQEYNTLGDLVLDCRRLTTLPSGMNKASLFVPSLTSASTTTFTSTPITSAPSLPEPLDRFPLNLSQNTNPGVNRIGPLEQ